MGAVHRDDLKQRTVCLHELSAKTFFVTGPGPGSCPEWGGPKVFGGGCFFLLPWW